MKLFVYGTLAPGEPNEHILKNVNGTWERGIVRGQLLPSGWGATLGFPGIVLNSTGVEVHGLVFSSPELEDYWETLDRFEGEGYQRVVASALLESGEFVEVFIYELSEAGSG